MEVEAAQQCMRMLKWHEIIVLHFFDYFFARIEKYTNEHEEHVEFRLQSVSNIERNSSSTY